MLVRHAASTRIPLSIAIPAPCATSTFGWMPTATITMSHSILRPLFATARSTRPAPSKRTTVSWLSSWTPASSWMPAMTSPISGPRTESRGRLPGKTAVTSSFSWRSEAATSEPMKPMPTMSALTPGLLDGVAVGHGPQLEDVGEVGTGHDQAPVPPARGEQQLRVLDRATGVQGDRAHVGVDRGRPGPDLLDLVRGVPLRGLDQPARQVSLAAEVRLRQRRPAERDARIVADQQDAPFEACVAKRLRGHTARHAGADDHQGSRDQSAIRLTRSPPAPAASPRPGPGRTRGAR